VIWTPGKNTVLRAAYTQSLSGASLDQSFQLEPTQVAGFNQAFRSIIPEAVSAANAGARFQTYGVSLEQKLHRRTYLALSGEVLNSKVARTLGSFVTDLNTFTVGTPSGAPERLDYQEKSLLFTADQLLSDEWSLVLRYRIS